ncbi:MAG: hypothetical protein ACRYFK_11860 [Janthinobacterium lividum]
MARKRSSLAASASVALAHVQQGQVVAGRLLRFGVAQRGHAFELGVQQLAVVVAQH